MGDESRPIPAFLREAFPAEDGLVDRRQTERPLVYLAAFGAQGMGPLPAFDRIGLAAGLAVRLLRRFHLRQGSLRPFELLQFYSNAGQSEPELFGSDNTQMFADLGAVLSKGMHTDEVKAREAATKLPTIGHSRYVFISYALFASAGLHGTYNVYDVRPAAESSADEPLDELGKAAEQAKETQDRFVRLLQDFLRKMTAELTEKLRINEFNRRLHYKLAVILMSEGAPFDPNRKFDLMLILAAKRPQKLLEVDVDAIGAIARVQSRRVPYPRP